MRYKSGEFSHGIGAKRKNARMFADQGAGASRLNRVTSEAVNAGVGGKSPRGGFQLLAEVVKPPDRQMTFLDEPGDAWLQYHAGLMGNPSRIGRDEPQQVLIQVCVREVGSGNSLLHPPTRRKVKRRRRRREWGGGGRWRGKGVARGSRGSEKRAYQAAGRASSTTGSGPAPRQQKSTRYGREPDADGATKGKHRRDNEEPKEK